MTTPKPRTIQAVMVSGEIIAVEYDLNCQEIEIPVVGEDYCLDDYLDWWCKEYGSFEEGSRHSGYDYVHDNVIDEEYKYLSCEDCTVDITEMYEDEDVDPDHILSTIARLHKKSECFTINFDDYEATATLGSLKEVSGRMIAVYSFE